MNVLNISFIVIALASIVTGRGIFSSSEIEDEHQLIELFDRDLENNVENLLEDSVKVLNFQLKLTDLLELKLSTSVKPPKPTETTPKPPHPKPTEASSKPPRPTPPKPTEASSKPPRPTTSITTDEPPKSTTRPTSLSPTSTELDPSKESSQSSVISESSIASQTLWVDIDSGKVVGVSPGQNQQQPQRPQQQYPQQNNGNFGRRNRWRQQNSQPQLPFIQQPIDPTMNNINAEWVCRNSRTGDTMIIASEINNRTPEQQQPNYQQPPIYNTDNPYQHNPWLDRNGQNLPQQNNPQGTLPNPNGQYAPDINSGNNFNNYPTIIQPTTTTPAPTKPPIIPTTSTKKPFPTLDNIDWTKYLETTTKKSNSQSLSRAIDGEGIIMARGGV
ncbi:hypothetical protein PV328_006457 [Microctonus aethiopoides]|uniref:Uncharacterized protein n=1 Tax=Microctonus aethiopoides TaxID=144406 RepID=A0AA39FPI7_9HYME|nr:hypothetical protein PV328_006457 [Microctonus aethiopoides]